MRHGAAQGAVHASVCRQFGQTAPLGSVRRGGLESIFTYKLVTINMLVPYSFME